MATHPSAEKRHRQAERRTAVNRARLSRVRTFVKKVESAGPRDNIPAISARTKLYIRLTVDGNTFEAWTMKNF